LQIKKVLFYIRKTPAMVTDKVTLAGVFLFNFMK